jgi:anti-anti-sigma factor
MRVEHKIRPAGESASPQTWANLREGVAVPSALFTVAVHFNAARAVVVLRGELDLMTVPLLVDCFAGLVLYVDEVVLDFAELDFIDCSGLHVIAETAQRLASEGGSLSIRSPRPQAQRVLELVHFEQIVAIQP